MSRSLRPAMAMLGLGLSLFSERPASAQGLSAYSDAPKESVESSAINPQALCAEVCNPDEACIDGRCLSMCSPGCRAGTYCAPTAECLPIPQAATRQETEGEMMLRRGASSKDLTHAALLDVGGVIFLGIRPTYEWGSKHAFQLRLQYMNTGFMTYKVEQQNEFERVQWGAGISFGYRHYETAFGNLRGFYYGGGVNYSLVGVNDVLRDYVEIITHYPGFYGEFGYRWVFSDFVFGFGPALGLRFPVKTHYRALAPGSCADTGDCQRDNEARFEGTMVVEVGWLL